MDPAALGEVLLEWLQVLERVLGVEEPGATSGDQHDEAGTREECWKSESLEQQQQQESLSSGEPTQRVADEHPELSEKEHQGEGNSTAPESGQEEEKEGEAEENTCHGTPEPVRVEPPTPLPSELLGELTQLATLYLELSCFRRQAEERRALGVAGFLRRYFFLLDTERVRRTCLLCYKERPEVQSSFIEAMQGETSWFFYFVNAHPNLVVLQLNGRRKKMFSPSTELTRSSKVVEVIQKGDLLKSLRGLRELQPWSAPELLAHSHRSVPPPPFPSHPLPHH